MATGMSFQKFIVNEMDKRKMSARAFAEHIGVSSNTINAYVNGKEITPTLDFLQKLAQKTDTSLVTIIKLAFPGETDDIDIDPEVYLLAKELSELPESVRDIIKTIMRSQTLLSNSHQTS
jgi:transcriptional regulator with XRE-family HTH domain